MICFKGGQRWTCRGCWNISLQLTTAYESTTAGNLPHKVHGKEWQEISVCIYSNTSRIFKYTILFTSVCIFSRQWHCRCRYCFLYRLKKQNEFQRFFPPCLSVKLINLDAFFLATCSWSCRLSCLTAVKKTILQLIKLYTMTNSEPGAFGAVGCLSLRLD